MNDYVALGTILNKSQDSMTIKLDHEIKVNGKIFKKVGDLWTFDIPDTTKDHIYLDELNNMLLGHLLLRGSFDKY